MNKADQIVMAFTTLHTCLLEVQTKMPALLVADYEDPFHGPASVEAVEKAIAKLWAGASAVTSALGLDLPRIQERMTRDIFAIQFERQHGRPMTAQSLREGLRDFPEMLDETSRATVENLILQLEHEEMLSRMKPRAQIERERAEAEQSVDRRWTMGGRLPSVGMGIGAEIAHVETRRFPPEEIIGRFQVVAGNRAVGEILQLLPVPAATDWAPGAHGAPWPSEPPVPYCAAPAEPAADSPASDAPASD